MVEISIDYETLKYTVIASCLPVIQAYAIWGTELVFIPYLLFFSIFIVITTISKIQNRLFYLLLVVLIFSLLTSHGVTSLVVSLVLPGLFVAVLMYKYLRKKQSSLNLKRIGFIAALFAFCLSAYWSITGSSNLNSLVSTLNTLLEPSIPIVPKSFIRLSLIPQLQIFSLLNMANLVVAIFTLIGILLFSKLLIKKKKIDETTRLYIIIITLIIEIGFFVIAQAIFNFGLFSYQRLLIYAFPLCFFPIGIALSRINLFLRRVIPRARLVLVASLLIALVFLCLVQVFPSQSLVPKATVLSNGLPSNEFILDLSLVNTVFQTSMISFADKYYANGPVVADVVTRSQCYGFSDPSFFTNINYNSPLTSSLSNMTWQLYLLHTSAAGPFGEQPQYRTNNIIENTIETSGNLIYDNGASFVLYNPAVNLTGSHS